MSEKTKKELSELYLYPDDCERVAVFIKPSLSSDFNYLKTERVFHANYTEFVYVNASGRFRYEELHDTIIRDMYDSYGLIWDSEKNIFDVYDFIRSLGYEPEKP